MALYILLAMDEIASLLQEQCLGLFEEGMDG
jgi:hypothetical protein